MSDAYGQDEDAPVFKIKEEQKAPPALEHHGTNTNSNGSASKDMNDSKHNPLLNEIRMPQQADTLEWQIDFKYSYTYFGHSSRANFV